MFDDLRESASVNLNENEFDEADFQLDGDDGFDTAYQDEKLFMGMTAQQRFILTLVILFMSCILGGFCLVLTGKVVLPFL